MLLDASALLALFLQEPGQDIVAELAPRSFIASANLIEVLSHRAVDHASVQLSLDLLQLTVLPMGRAEADIAGLLLRRHRGKLSLGDCACIATAELHRLPVLTADRIWATLPLPVEVRLIRP